MQDPFCLIALPGFTKKEAKALELFSERMRAISLAEKRPLHLFVDGAPVLADVVREVFPKYSDTKAVKFMLRSLKTINEAMRLHAAEPGGSA
jgi:hypothetical protein